MRSTPYPPTWGPGNSPAAPVMATALPFVNAAGDILQRKILLSAVTADLLWRLPVGAMEFLFTADLPSGSPKSPRAWLGAMLDDFARSAARGEHPGRETMDELVRRAVAGMIPETVLAVEAEWSVIRSFELTDPLWVMGQAVQWYRRQRLGEALYRASERIGPNPYDRQAYDDAVADLRRAIQNPEDTDDPAEPDGPVLTQLSTVEPEEVTWLWPHRIARGKVNLLIGDPGTGKSLLMTESAARVTMGQPWPDGTSCPRGDVLILSAEDGVADTIRPRLDRFGGDPRRVHVLEAIRQGGRQRTLSLAVDLPHVEAAIETTHAILVIVDPLSAYLGAKADSFKDSDIRALLYPLAKLADRQGAAIVPVMHLTKHTQRRALYRALGSVAFVAAGRSVLALARDPEGPDRRLLVSVKSNLSTAPPTLAFVLTKQGRMNWEPKPVIGATADTLLGDPAPPEEKSDRQDAEELLRELLTVGTKVKAKDIYAAARENGLSEKAVYRAKQALGIKALRKGGAGKDGWWVWVMPGSPGPSPEEFARRKQELEAFYRQPKPPVYPPPTDGSPSAAGILGILGSGEPENPDFSTALPSMKWLTPSSPSSRSALVPRSYRVIGSREVRSSFYSRSRWRAVLAGA